MTYDFETLVDRRNIGAEKWDMMRAAKPTVADSAVPLSVADMEFVIAPEIRRALIGYINEQIPGYTAATEEFRRAVCDFFRRRHGLSVSPDEIVQTPGVVYALPRALRALTHPGDGVIIMTPVYYPFFSAVEHAGCRLVTCPLVETEGRYTIDFSLLETLAKEKRNTALLLCSPHNPVGRVFSETELRRVAEICRRWDVGVVSDEIHFDLILPGHTHFSMAAPDSPVAERAIVCTAPSKTFNLAGMNLSNIIIRSPSLRKSFGTILQNDNTPMQNPFGYVACQAAYEHGDAWLSQLISYLDGNRAYVEKTIRETIPALRVTPMEGTYLQWIDCRALRLAPSALEKQMLRHDLFFDEGILFGTEGAGFERLNLACPRRVLEDALVRLKAAAEEL